MNEFPYSDSATNRGRPEADPNMQSMAIYIGLGSMNMWSHRLRLQITGRNLFYAPYDPTLLALPFGRSLMAQKPWQRRWFGIEATGARTECSLNWQAGVILQLRRCPKGRDRAECPQGPLGRCSEGREGQACNNCEPGYYSRGSTCERCREGDALPVILVLILSEYRHGGLTDQPAAHGHPIPGLNPSLGELSINWQEPVATLINLTKLVMFDFHFIRTSCFFGTDNPVLYFVGVLT
eukprot:s4982_g6.t3